MIEKLKNLQWHMQLLVLVGIAALIYAGVWYFVTSATRAEVVVLEDQVSQLQAKNEAARIATQRINEFRQQFASKTEEYDELKVLLPEQREISNIVQTLNASARDSQLLVMRFVPRDDAPQDSIMAKPVEVEVDANYNNLRSFFAKIAKLPRIVSVTDFKLHQIPDQSASKTLHAQFMLTAYYASADNLAPATPAPGAPGAPAPGQPAPPAPAPVPVTTPVTR